MRILLPLLAGFGIMIFVIVLRSVRREHIRVEHSVSWLVASAVLILLSVAMSMLPSESQTAEIADTLLFLIIAIALWIGYRSSRVSSELKDMNITLTQRVAMLEFHIRELNEKTKNTN